jgi:hypothetical protein
MFKKSAMLNYTIQLVLAILRAITQLPHNYNSTASRCPLTTKPYSTSTT